MTHQETLLKQRLPCGSQYLSSIQRFTESPTASSDNKTLDSDASVHGEDIDTCLYGSVVGIEQLMKLGRKRSTEADPIRPSCKGFTSSLSPCAFNAIRRYSYGSNQTTDTAESVKSEGYCEECDRTEAKQHCEECGMKFCFECDAHWHRKGRLRYHNRTLLNSALSSQKSYDPMTLCEPFVEDKEPVQWAVRDVITWLRSLELDIFLPEVEKYKIDGVFLLSNRMDAFLNRTSQKMRGEKRKFAREVLKLKRR